MPQNPQYAVRLPKDQAERFEEYCEEKDISYAEALRRFTIRELEIEEGNQVRIAVQQSGSQQKEKEENEPIADGGQVIRPSLRLLGSLYASVALLIFLFLSLVAYFNISIPASIIELGFKLMLSTLIVAALIIPILYSSLPEKVDKRLYSGIGKASEFIPQKFKV